MPRNGHKIWQELRLSSLSFTWTLALRHYYSPFALAFVFERSTKNEAFEEERREERVLSLFLSSPTSFGARYAG